MSHGHDMVGHVISRYPLRIRDEHGSQMNHLHVCVDRRAHLNFHEIVPAKGPRRYKFLSSVERCDGSCQIVLQNPVAAEVREFIRGL